MKNYYQILNIKMTATDEEIKRNYRVLAKKYHPDVNPGDELASIKFTDINAAYETLSNPASRAEYDKKLRDELQKSGRASGDRQSPINNGYGERGAGGASGTSWQAQASQQFEAAKNAAYKSGYDKANAEAQREAAKLNATIKSLNAELQRCKDKIAESADARKDVEQELYARGRELTQAKNRQSELERQLQVATKSIERMQEKTSASSQSTDAQLMALRIELKSVRDNYTALQLEKRQNEILSKTQTEKQENKQRQLQSDMTELKKKYTELVKTYKKAMDDNAALTEKSKELDKARAELLSARDQLSELRAGKASDDMSDAARLEEQLDKRHKLQTELNVLKIQSEELKKALKDALSENAQLSRSNKNTDEMSAELKALKAKLVSMQSELNSSNAKHKAKVEQLKNKEQQLKSDNDMLSAKVGVLNKALKEARDTRTENRRNAARNSESELTALKNELKNAQEHSKKLKAEKHAADARHKEQLDAERRKNEFLQDENERLKTAVVAGDNKDELEMLRAKLSGAQDRIAELQSDKVSVDLKTKLENEQQRRARERLENDNQAAKAKLAEQKDQIAELKAKLAEANKAAKAQADAGAKAERESAAALAAVKAELKAERDASKQQQKDRDLDALKTQNIADQQQKKVDRLQAELEGLRQKNAELTRSLDEQKQAADDIKSDYEDKLGAARDQLARAEETASAARSDKRKTDTESKTALAQLQKENKRLKTENGGLNAKLERLNKSLSELREEHSRTLKSDKDSLSGLNTDLRSANAQVQDLKHKWENAEQRASLMNKKLQEQTAENERLKKQIDKLTAQPEGASEETKFNLMRAELDRGNAKYDKLMERYADSSRKLEELKAANAELTAENEELKAKYNELKAKTSTLTDTIEDVRFQNDLWHEYADVEEEIFNAQFDVKDARAEDSPVSISTLSDGTYYGLLGVYVWATQEDLDKAMESLSKLDMLEPDIVKRINRAYEVLSDPQSRAEYDAANGITPEMIEQERANMGNA